MELSDAGELQKGAIYHPFGREMVSVSATPVLPPLGSGGISGTHGSRYSFAGKEKDRESDVHYFEWRYYDDGSGRFTSVDPVYYEVGITERGKEALLDPELSHPYIYARNGPLRYVDPTGQTAAVAGVVGGVAAAVIMNDENTRNAAIGGVAIGIYGIAKTFGYKPGTESSPSTSTSPSPSLQDFSDQMSTPPVNFTPAAGTGGPSPGGGKDPKKEKSVNQIQKEIEKGKAPRSIDRVDKGNPTHGEQDHIHIQPNNSAINRDGTWKHGGRPLTKPEIEWLKHSNWGIPK